MELRMSDLFTRHGKVPFPGHVHHTAKGKPFLVQKKRCGRCGGVGRSDRWAATGYVCFDCGGVGHRGDEAVNLYTADQIAKMDATAAKAAAKRQVKADAIAAVYAAEALARGEDFRREYAQLLEMTAGSEDAFISDVMGRANAKNRISQKAAEAVVAALFRNEERATKRAASRHVGTIGERREFAVTVDRVSTFTRPCFAASWQSETVYIVTMRDADLNAIVAKGTSFSAEKGETFKIKATIKEHSSYNEEAQTIVQRIKVL